MPACPPGWMQPGRGCPEALHVAAHGPCAGRGGKRGVGWKWLPWHSMVPQCWQAWPQHPQSSVWALPTTVLSLLPHPSPGASPESLAAPSQLAVGVLQKDLCGCLWHPLPNGAFWERELLSWGLGTPGLCAPSIPPGPGFQPCSVMVVSGHLQALAADPRPCS